MILKGNRGNVGSPSQLRRAGKSVAKNVVTLLPRVDSTDSIGSHSGDERLSGENIQSRTTSLLCSRSALILLIVRDGTSELTDNRGRDE